MTNQADFDFAARKIIEQGKPSVNESSACMYRGPNGLKCAIGHMIPDAEYYPLLEGKGAYHDLVQHVPSLHGKDFDLLRAIQVAHDNSVGAQGNLFIVMFKAEMRQVARRFRLDPAVLDEVALDQSKAA